MAVTIVVREEREIRKDQMLARTKSVEPAGATEIGKIKSLCTIIKAKNLDGTALPTAL